LRGILFVRMYPMFFFEKRHLGRGLPRGQRGEPGFEPRTGRSTLGDFASCSRHFFLLECTLYEDLEELSLGELLEML
jgi:hypothetical protein